MADPNKAMLDKAIRALERRLEQDRKVNWPAALERIGRATIRYSQETKNYGDISGNLRSGYSYVVVPPGESANFEFEAKNESGSIPIEGRPNELRLVYGNGVHYAIFVELRHGLDVSIQTYLWLRREFRRLFKENFRGEKL